MNLENVTTREIIEELESRDELDAAALYWLRGQDLPTAQGALEDAGLIALATPAQIAQARSMDLPEYIAIDDDSAVDDVPDLGHYWIQAWLKVSTKDGEA